jgi:hypothetical protein
MAKFHNFISVSISCSQFSIGRFSTTINALKILMAEVTSFNQEQGAHDRKVMGPKKNTTP